MYLCFGSFVVRALVPSCLVAVASMCNNHRLVALPKQRRGTAERPRPVQSFSTLVVPQLKSKSTHDTGRIYFWHRSAHDAFVYHWWCRPKTVTYRQVVRKPSGSHLIARCEEWCLAPPSEYVYIKNSTHIFVVIRWFTINICGMFSWFTGMCIRLVIGQDRRSSAEKQNITSARSAIEC